MPGHKMMQRRGTTRIPPQAWRPRLSAWIVANSSLRPSQSGFKPRMANQPKYQIILPLSNAVPFKHYPLVSSVEAFSHTPYS
jgi:hypothetical protein